MSLTNKYELRKVAQKLAREMRNNPTPAERKFWGIVRKKKIDNVRFLRQHPVYHDYLGKESFYISDFYIAELRLIIEIDGPIHKFNFKADIERTDILNLLGFKVIRFTNEEVLNNTKNVTMELKKIIKELKYKNNPPIKKEIL